MSKENRSKENRLEFIKKFREEAASKNEKETNGEKEGLGEETKREINQHLEFVEKGIMSKLLIRSYRRQRERPSSAEEVERYFEESKSHEKDEKEWQDYFKKAKEQLEHEKSGKEILEVILKFPTDEQLRAEDNLHRYKRLLEKQNLEPDNLPPNHSSKRMIDIHKKEIEFEQGKRRKWVEYIKEK